MNDIPVVILAGGLGMRIREETEFKPKPMIAIGERPILWHIMKTYSHHGLNKFIVCLGYKGEIIKRYFLNFRLMHTDFTVKLSRWREVKIHNDISESKWEVTLAETGLSAMTGARIRKIKPYVRGPLFMATYGDGVADVNIRELLRFHKSHGKIATITGVNPPSRFGELVVDKRRVMKFSEKPNVANHLINGGFFIFNTRVFDYLSEDDACTLEKEPLERLARDGQLMVYPHAGFWQCMDTVRDMNLLNDMWAQGRAPWKKWKA